jgi:hypothetical protein
MATQTKDLATECLLERPIMPHEDQSTTPTLDPIAQPTTTASGQRPPWTPGQKTKGRKAPKLVTSTKRALKLSVEAETHERLTIHALKSGLNLSELVDKLARENCNEWVLHAKPGPKS